MATRRRIMKELDDMAKDTSSGMHATPLDPSDMTHLQGRFKGPPGTPYEGGEFVIDIKLPDNYPFMPPKMKFETKVWHPNVSSQTVISPFLPLVFFLVLAQKLFSMVLIGRYRARSVWILSRRNGRRCLRSRLHSYHCSRSSMLPNHRIRRMPRLHR